MQALGLVRISQKENLQLLDNLSFPPCRVRRGPGGAGRRRLVLRQALPAAG